MLIFPKTEGSESELSFSHQGSLVSLYFHHISEYMTPFGLLEISRIALHHKEVQGAKVSGNNRWWK